MKRIIFIAFLALSGCKNADTQPSLPNGMYEVNLPNGVYCIVKEGSGASSIPVAIACDFSRRQ